MTADYPPEVGSAMLRIQRHWSPRPDQQGRLSQHLPALIETAYRRPDGKRVRAFIEAQRAMPGELEQAQEFHRRQAKRLLRLLTSGSVPRAVRGTLAHVAAVHMMHANLACQFFNQRFKQDPLQDLPFPLETEE